MNKITIENRMIYAKKSLLGLSIGDAFGDTFFGCEDEIKNRIKLRKVLPEKWLFTDDTVMGIAIYEILRKYGQIRQDELAASFAKNYILDTHRKYGGTAHGILRDIGEGKDWRIISPAVFDGMGSMGNGAAMRAAPIGAYFYDDLEMVKRQAKLSAEITHSNLEGIAGAVAIAVAAGVALNNKLNNCSFEPVEFINKVFEETPESDTRYKIRKAARVSKNSDIEFAISVLGNGIKLTAQDTVPIAIWFMANYINNYEEALWNSVSALGDRDTICAMVGSVVALYVDDITIPKLWIDSTESIEDSVFMQETTNDN